MTKKYVKRIRTADGDLLIDYNSLANLPDLTKKADKRDIINDSTATDAIIEFLEPNSEKVYAELLSVEVTLPTEINLDYMSSIVFSTPSEIPTDYTIFPLSVYFKGDECDEGIFVPNPSTRYTILFYYDGVNTIGLVSGIEVTASE